MTRLGATALLLSLALRANAELIRSVDGTIVYDTVLRVVWLSNANLAATSPFGVSNINPSGSMTYTAALQWVAALNAQNYLGQNDWQLPATPALDPTCSSLGPNGDTFGIGCVGSTMGLLFYQSLGLQYPNTAVPIPGNTVGLFSNIQPYLYWSATLSTDAAKGYRTFSFNSGWVGENVDKHYLYVLPMIAGRLPGTPPPAGNRLQASADGQTVYDPVADVTWLANANLAKTHTFNAQCQNSDGSLCINPDGSMSHSTAVNWINGMNAAHYLGQSNWQLPSIPNTDSSCSQAGFGFHCTGNPFGMLYYTQWMLPAGTPVAAAPNVQVGPFTNLQPYLYWSCLASPTSQILCQSAAPVPGFGWSFSFGNGFLGTDVVSNDLYVMVYYPEQPSPPRRRAVSH